MSDINLSETGVQLTHLNLSFGPLKRNKFYLDIFSVFMRKNEQIYCITNDYFGIQVDFCH